MWNVVFKTLIWSSAPGLEIEAVFLVLKWLRSSRQKRGVSFSLNVISNSSFWQSMILENKFSHVLLLINKSIFFLPELHREILSLLLIRYTLAQGLSWNNSKAFVSKHKEWVKVEMPCHSQREVEGPLAFPHITEAIICHLFTLQMFVELLLCANLRKGDRISILEWLTI